MQNDILCAMLTQAHTIKKKQDPPQKHHGPIQRVWEATKLNAETRDPMEIYTPVHMDCMCYVSGCNLHGGYNMMLSMVYLGRTLKLMQNGLRTTGIGYNTVKMRFMCM